jgi:hypothetical protein
MIGDAAAKAAKKDLEEQAPAPKEPHSDSSAEHGPKAATKDPNFTSSEKHGTLAEGSLS